MCETDFSGYPDCRNDTIQTLAETLSLGLASQIAIETPLMFIDKAATWDLAERLGGDDLIKIIVDDTHTCYLGDRSHRHDWGFGCGACPACELREKGWNEWQARKHSSAPSISP
jgi:7-cyano-7-deazaguanine synthase